MSDLQVNVDVSRLGLDSSKPTVMVVSDSAAIHSGFAQVVRNIFKRLWTNRKWNIVQYGWWHAQAEEKVPWPIITTERDASEPSHFSMADKYGERTFERVVANVRPDLVWVMGDPWMVGPTLQNAYSNTYTKVLYAPVDGAPLIYSWKILEQADVVVPYLPWGKKMIEKWIPKAKVADPIPHGVDLSTFKPVDDTMRAAIRRDRYHVDPNTTLILSVCRNQGRKNIPALIEMMYYIRSGDYTVCSSCGRAWRNPFDYSLGQPTGEKAECKDPTCWEEYAGGAGHRSPKMIPGTPNLDACMYIHSPIKDIQGHSWRLTDLMDAFGMGELSADQKEIKYPGFRWNENLQPVHGMNEEDLSNLYAAADIFTVATTGEGFGLPIIEAMACGVPVVVPNISSHPDFVGQGGGLLVDIAHYINEPVSSYFRGYPDLDHYLSLLLLLIKDKSFRKGLGAAARVTAEKYDWDGIAKQWSDLIDRYLPRRDKRAKGWQRAISI